MKTDKEDDMGQPSKLTKMDIRLIRYMYKKGATDQEVADELGVCRKTIHNWQVANPDFKESMKDWKSEADEEVERSLFERAKGYKCKETKLFCHEGMVIAEDVIKHYPPDATSCIFWLKNRKPDQWREKSEVVTSAMDLEEFLKQQSEKK
jgi:DNA-binding XRE family transcriptional regulator